MSNEENKNKDDKNLKATRFLAGELNDEETRELNEDLQQDKTFLLEMADLLLQHVELATLLKKPELRKTEKTTSSKVKVISLIFTAAAALAILVTGWQLFFTYPEPQVSDTIKVAAGGKLERGTDLETGNKGGDIKLGGYCDIRMAKKSKIRLEGKKNQEQIYLEKGKTECRVTKKKGTFIVRTDLGQIKVLGTHFTVGVYNDSQKRGEEAMNLKKMFVKVMAGAVMLSSAYGDDLVIKAGEAVVIDKQAGVQKVELDKIPAWVEKYAKEKGFNDVPSYLGRYTRSWSFRGRKYKDQPKKKITFNFEVVDYETGKPLPEILVTSEGKYAFTNAKGKSPKLTIEVPENAWEIGVNSIHPSYIPFSKFGRNKVSITEGDIVRIALYKDPTVTAKGMVLDATGSPIKGSAVSVFYKADQDDDEWIPVIDSNSEPDMPDVEKTVDFNGETYLVSKVRDFFFMLNDGTTTSRGDKGFSLTFPPIEDVDKYKVVASYPNVGLSEKVVSKTELGNVELKLKPEGGITIAGTFFDAKGNPAPNVELDDELSAAKTNTDANGKFSFKYCYPEMYYFDIRLHSKHSKRGKRPQSIYPGTYGDQELDNLQIYLGGERAGGRAPQANINDKYSQPATEKRGIKALAETDFYKADKEFSRSLLFGIATNNKNNFANRAISRLGKGEAEKALQDAEAGVRANPLSRYQYFVRGWINALANKWDKAETDFAKCAKLGKDPYDALALYISGKKTGKDHSKALPVIGDKWPAPISEMLQGKITLDQCLEKAGQDNNKQTEAFFYAAFNEKDKNKSAEHLENALLAEGKSTMEYILTKIKHDGNTVLPKQEVRANGVTETFMDFDVAGLKEDWNPSQGDISLNWKASPKLPIQTLGPQGNGLDVKTKGKSFIYLNRDKLALPKDLKDCEAVSLWVYNKNEKSKPNLEVQFLEPKGRGKFWRRVAITKPGWQKITVPLRFMRWGNLKAPNWDKVEFLGIYFRDKADLLIDNVAFLKGTGKNALLSANEMSAIAFPDKEAHELKILDTPDIRVISDAPDLDLDVLTKHLEKFVSSFKKDFPFVKNPAGFPTLLIFKDKKDYQKFTPRFAAMLSAGGAKPTSGGYTFMGIAQSYWSSKYGTKRPVYGHEFLHAYIELATSLPSSSGDWVQEGIANYYQTKIHPQANLKSIIKNGVRSPSKHTKLKTLLNGKRIKMDRYWQALSVIDLLINNPSYKQHLEKLLTAFEEDASTNLGPHLDIIEKDWPQLDKDWQDHCKKI